MINPTKATLLGMLLAVSALAREDYTRHFDKTFTLKPGQTVLVEHKLGEIVIHTHPQLDLTIHAEIHVSASDRSRAEQFANQIEILTEPFASEFSIRTRYPENPGSFLGFNNISYSVRYEITMPESAPLEVRNSFGAVSVTGLKANGNIRTSHGNLTFRDGKGVQRLEDSFASVELSGNGGDVAIDNTNGNVKVADVAGALTVRDRFASVSAERIAKDVTITNTNGTVDVTDSGGMGIVKNSFGTVTVHNFHGDMTVHNGNGEVEALNVTGMAELNTSFAAVRFSDIGRGLSVRANNSRIEGSKIKGPVKIENSFGGVTLTGVDGGASIQSANGAVTITGIHGEANVKTSFAGVDLQQVTGAIDVDNQNGAVDAASNSQSGCQRIMIHTSFSPIRIHLSGNPSYRVTASTSFGKIRSDFPLTVSGSMSSDNLSGTIGDGRCEMRLTDNNGAIEILNSSSH